MDTKNVTKVSKLETYILENTPQRIHERYQGLTEFAEQNFFGVLDEDVVVLDTETTGFSFNHDELIQIAAARMKNGVITEWYVTFVNPDRPIPEEVAHLTNIHDDDVVDAPSPDEALTGLVEFVGDSYVVAHNANFDRTFTTKRASGESLKNNIWVDSLDLARIALPRMNSHRLLDLVRAFGGPDSTHRADEDVAATCLVYRILLAAVKNMPSDLVKYISEMSTIDEWNTVYVFKELADERAGSYNFRVSRKTSVSSVTEAVRKDVFKPFTEAEQGVSPDMTDEEFFEKLNHLEFATSEEIYEAFSKEGAVGQCYVDYEPREEQRVMAQAVNNAVSRSENLAIEAGTGVGKSMAYLVPLVLAAQKNKMTVGVATKTNTLLDQLINKELPLLKKVYGISYAPLKGFTHYPCNRKVERLVAAGPRIITFKNQEINQAPALASLLSFVDQSDFDDMDGLKLDYRALPRYSITTKSSECLRRKCPFFGRSCFVHGAREEAQRCDVVVTNHSLLFWDVRFEGGLLPPIRYWVIDEAHGAEDEARRAFSTTVSSDAIQNLARRMTSDSPRYNVFLRAERAIEVTEEAKTLFESMIRKAQIAAGSFGIAAQEFCLAAKDLLFFDERSKRNSYEYFDLWLNDDIRASETFSGVKFAAKGLYETLEKAISAARDIVAYLESIEVTSSEQREIALVALELKELYVALETIFFTSASNQVYSVRLNRTKDRFNEIFTAQPLDVGQNLNETFYQETNSVIYTSATLSVDGKFDSFEQAVGLNESEVSCGITLQIDSSYDFDNHMQVYVPSDMPEPADPQYLEKLQELLIGLHIAQQGSLLTLFTNRREMEKCFEVVNPQIKKENLRLVCQKWGVSVKGLRDDFLKDEHLSLFALKSFWEGFDAPGSTLRGVVIPKLPFGLPTDPLSCERGARDDRAWSHYSLPAAVIDVKQAVGRLIRSANDEGIVVLADARLISKYYGRKFLNSLPSKSVSIIPCEDIIKEVAHKYLHD